MQHRRGHLVVRGVDAGGGGTRRPALWATRMVQWRTQQRRGRPRRRQLGAIHSSLVGSCRWCAPSSADCRGRLAVLSKEPAQGATCEIGFPEPSAWEAKAARSPIGASAAETSRRRGCRGALPRGVQWRGGSCQCRRGTPRDASFRRGMPPKWQRAFSRREQAVNTGPWDEDPHPARIAWHGHATAIEKSGKSGATSPGVCRCHKRKICRCHKRTSPKMEE